MRLWAIAPAPGGGLEGALGPDEKRPNETQLRANLDAIVAPVKNDMNVMETNVKALVGERHPMLLAAAEQIFGAGGKKIRPVLCFLVARATAVSMGLPCVPQRGTAAPAFLHLADHRPNPGAGQFLGTSWPSWGARFLRPNMAGPAWLIRNLLSRAGTSPLGTEGSPRSQR